MDSAPTKKLSLPSLPQDPYTWIKKSARRSASEIVTVETETGRETRGETTGREIERGRGRRTIAAASGVVTIATMKGSGTGKRKETRAGTGTETEREEGIKRRSASAAAGLARAAENVGAHLDGASLAVPSERSGRCRRDDE